MSQVVKFTESNWLPRIAAVMIPVALYGLLTEASWVHSGSDSPYFKATILAVFGAYELYLLARGVWPAELLVDTANRQIILQANCPWFYQPRRVPFAEVKKILAMQQPLKTGNPNLYALVIITHDDERLMLGDHWRPDRDKYEAWRDRIAECVGIDNITRLSELQS